MPTTPEGNKIKTKNYGLICCSGGLFRRPEAHARPEGNGGEQRSLGKEISAERHVRELWGGGVALLIRHDKLCTLRFPPEFLPLQQYTESCTKWNRTVRRSCPPPSRSSTGSGGSPLHPCRGEHTTLLGYERPLIFSLLILRPLRPQKSDVSLKDLYRLDEVLDKYGEETLRKMEEGKNKKKDDDD